MMAKKTDVLDIQDEENVLDMFNKELNQNSESVRELFNEKNIKVKSDLDKHHISIIARLYFQAKLTDLPELMQICDEFITLRVSRDRLSRKEFVQAVQPPAQDDGGGFFNKFGNMFNRQQ